MWAQVFKKLNLKLKEIFRFVINAWTTRRTADCSAFLDSDELQIIEYPQRIAGDSSHAFESDIWSSPLPPFAAISYPWRDLQLPSGSSTSSFSVSGATHADPISIDVLRTACLAARMFSCDYIWLDRLCILQTQKKDKNWQIQRMFSIYKACNICLVLPGGLVRLAGLDEPTTWIDRAWTLQEVVAPGETKAKCIFSFTHPTYLDFLEEQCNRKTSLVQDIVEAGHSALCSLDLLLRVMWGWAEWLRCFEPTLSKQHDKFPIRIMYDPAMNLLRRALLPSHRDLWMSAYTRSSSRPVDMVFSLMDLLGVSLDVKQYAKDDRLKATIKLMQTLMRRGEPAIWLYIAPWVKPSTEISTMPQMPETSESGRAYIKTQKGLVLAFEAVGFENTWRTDGAPKGEMTDSGYFTFWAKAALVNDWRETRCETDPYDNREIWAIIIGQLENLNRDPESWKLVSTPGGDPTPAGVYELTLMLVEHHGYGLFHRVGMEHEIDERKTADWDWKYREFHVGGPGRGERVRFSVSPEGHDLETEKGIDDAQDESKL
ncbi:hypothetical protein IW261DRAFT_1553532 [Armillaria novae-zelandiae]|uniref:Heterokaryon incompatibility domain-containing protein n=1 Tax=Armillaria novae-zelandiae TaxID=153914 RepID=A0AA39NT30_9AGAR|nr:hypothetical protein IW261DRAFT_1553532 [Armillaria novae-zelandiae]